MTSRPSRARTRLRQLLLSESRLGTPRIGSVAATLEDLIHVEAAGHLEWIYAALGLPTVGAISLAYADAAIQYFIVAYLTIGTESLPAIHSNGRR